MEKLLLMLIAASGLYVVSADVAKKFYLVVKAANWTEAQKYCRERFTDLATVQSNEEVEALRNLTDGEGITYAWIGLNDNENVNSGRWSLSNSSVNADRGVNFTNWAPTQPNNDGRRGHCVVMEDDGLWHDYECQYMYRAVCSNVQGSKVTYVLTDDSMFWTEAQTFCRATYTDLVSVRNSEENQKVRDLIPAGTRVWIGLFRDSWMWSDGSDSSFRFWYSNQPNGDEPCVAAYFGYSGEWFDSSCYNKRSFICYRAAEERTTTRATTKQTTSKLTTPPLPQQQVVTRKQVFKLDLKTDIPLDENDPEVMEQILEQYRQAMKKQGIEDVKLSWVKQADGKVFHRQKEEPPKKKKNKDEL